MTIYLAAPSSSNFQTQQAPGQISPSGLNSSVRQHGEVFRMRCFSHAFAKSGFSDSPKRPVSVFLPPTYRLDSTRRYPVVYLLHDLHQTDNYWIRNPRIFENIQHILNLSMKNDAMEEFIVVMPHALSQDSETMDATLMDAWEQFTSVEVVNWADAVLRTKPEAAFRGIAGIGMGAYGAMKLAFKCPERFGSVYGLSPVLSDWENHASTLRRLAVLKQSGRLNSLKDFYSPQKYQYLQQLIHAVPKAVRQPDAPSEALFREDDGHWQERPGVLASWRSQCLSRLLPEYAKRRKQLPRCAMDVDPKTDYRFVVNGCLRLQSAMKRFGVLDAPILWKSAKNQHVWGDEGRIAKALFPFFSNAFQAT